MEGHPIPQDVTGFQFKIIGNMTIKQFAYLATGSILAYLFFSLPIFILFKLILAAFFFLLGLMLAFVPIGGRPIDTMFFYFIRALFVPNQYIYQKTDKPAPTTKPVSPTIPPSPAQHQHPQNKEELNKEEDLLEKEIEEAKAVEAKEQPDPQKQEEAHKKTLLLEEQLKTVLLEKQELQKQLVELTQKLEDQKPKRKPPVASPPNNPPTQPTSMSDFPPNLINGIVKDPRGNILPNILIEVKDKEGNPVRAFKTNNLGQFAAATSLANGVYTLTFEDPNNIHKFTTVEITAQGEPINPMTIVSTDPRENLRKDLFGV